MKDLEDILPDMFITKAKEPEICDACEEIIPVGEEMILEIPDVKGDVLLHYHLGCSDLCLACIDRLRQEEAEFEAYHQALIREVQQEHAIKDIYGNM